MYPTREHGEWYIDPAERVLSLYETTASPVELRARIQREAFKIYGSLPLFKSIHVFAQYYGRLHSIRQVAGGCDDLATDDSQRASLAFLSGAVVAIDAMIPLAPPDMRALLKGSVMNFTIDNDVYDDRSYHYAVLDFVDAHCEAIDKQNINDDGLVEMLLIGEAMYADQPDSADSELSYFRGLMTALTTMGEAAERYMDS
ncbi:MAG: hypothetical protein WBB33_03770 [Candidatus Saccharimonadales bacterium]